MSAFLKIVSSAALLLFVPPFAAHAAPAKLAVPSKLASSCRLVLSLGMTGLPGLTVTLVNASPSAVKFFLNSHNPSLVVEHKAAGSPFSPTGWQRLKSNAELRRKPGDPGDTETFDILITVAPKQEYSRPLRLDNFPVAADSYYRITAEVDLPDAGKLTLRSNSIIIRRTASGFTAFPTRLEQAVNTSGLQCNVKLTTSMSPPQFEAWVVLAAQKATYAGQPPDSARKELLVRMKAGRYVTDTAILAVVAASADADTPLTPAGTLAPAHPAATYRLIDTLLGMIYERPGLSAELHRRKAMLYDLTHDWANAAREHAEAVRLLTPLHVAVDTQRLDSLVQEAFALLVLRKRQQAEDLYLEALSYDWYKITDPDALQVARGLYIQAGEGLISCRRGNLAALKEIYFVPAANGELQPVLQRAIKEAEGSDVPTPQATK